LYKIYIWGGLALFVVYTFVAVLILDSRNQLGTAGGPFIIIPLMVWFSGIMLYWWWVFLFKSNKELETLTETPAVDFPGIKSLKNWNMLHQAMTISGGDVDAFIKNAKKANRPIIIWFGCMNLLPCWIFAPFILGFLGIMPDIDSRVQLGVWLAGVFFWIVLMIVVTYALLGGGSRASEEAYLAPLGLAVARIPVLSIDINSLIGDSHKLIPDSPTILEGQRNGRLVHIETIAKFSLTILQATLPEFRVQSNEGKLTPKENAPKEVVDALKTLRKAKRWQGIQVFAGPDGIAIHRESKGKNMWLYDLWLAEFVLDKFKQV
jgi:hypothetical protein